jgi:hypothetical protein
MALGTVWAEVVNTNKLTEDNLQEIAEWAHRVYFGPGNVGKRWYRDGVTREGVLLEFLLPESPISPEALVEVWKAIPSLRAALERFDHNELDSVMEYLQRPKNVDTTPRYTQGDRTLQNMAADLGGITGTMVNKIFVSGADKLQRLTGGVSPMEMEGEDLIVMFAMIERAQLLAAAEYAALLMAFKGNIPAFIQSQVEALNLTEKEARLVSQCEQDGLMILSEMERNRIVAILLEDLNSDDTLFLSFQNAVSKKIFPRRSGRPKGSGKKGLKAEVLESDEIVVSAAEVELQEPVEI